MREARGDWSHSERRASGYGVAISASAPSGSGLQPLEIVRDRESRSVQRSQPLAPNCSPFGPPVVHVVPRSAEEGSRRPRVRAVGERLMSVREAAQALGVCTAIVYRLVDSGELGHARISNAIRIAPRDLVAYVIASKKSRERL